jgi:hypothetical protein
MRFLGVFGRVWKEVGICLRNICRPFGVGLEQCLSAVGHGVGERIVIQKTLLIYLTVSVAIGIKYWGFWWVCHMF